MTSIGRLAEPFFFRLRATAATIFRHLRHSFASVVIFTSH